MRVRQGGTHSAGCLASILGWPGWRLQPGQASLRLAEFDAPVFKYTTSMPLLLRLDRPLTAGLGIQFVDFASYLHQLAQFFEGRHSASKSGCADTRASCAWRCAPVVRRRLLDDDVEARVAWQRNHKVLIERQAV